MDAWQAVGTAVGLLLGIWGINHRQTLLIREDIKTAKGELREDIKTAKGELREDIKTAKEGLEARMDRSEAANQAEHAELKEQVRTQGEKLSDVREKVGELSGFTGQALAESLRRLMGKKDSGGPRDSA